MLNEQTKNLYKEVASGAKMGVRLVDDMIKKYDDDCFRRELLHAKDEYLSIQREAETALGRFERGEQKAVCERMATNMEVSAIWVFSKDDRPKLKDGLYPQADGSARNLAARLLALQAEHREIYRRFSRV